MNESGQTVGPLSGKRRDPAAIERWEHIRTQGRKAAQTAGLSTGSMAYTAEEGLRAYLARFLVKVIDPIDYVPSTAFFLNNNGFLLTCWHVVEPDVAGTVRDRLWAEYRGERYEAAVVKKLSNREKDVAVLRIAGKELQRLRSKGFDTAPLSFPYQRDDPVAALGYQRQDKLADPLLIRSYIDRDNTPSVWLLLMIRTCHIKKNLDKKKKVN
jgi:Trypsin-like peptidase domain